VSTETRMTVGEKRRNLEAHRAKLASDDSASSLSGEQRAKALANLDAEIVSLSGYDPERLLLTYSEALDSDFLDDEQKCVIRWQYAHVYDPGDFWRALFQAATVADAEHMNKLVLGFPEMNGIRRWQNEPGYAARLRAMPLDFSL
jgi:hypothetical protein